jgi:hypothetical protein
MTNICKECIEYGAMFERDKHVDTLYAKIEQMKCCGNCVHYTPMIGHDICDISEPDTPDYFIVNGSNKCDKWEMK